MTHNAGASLALILKSAVPVRGTARGTANRPRADDPADGRKPRYWRIEVSFGGFGETMLMVGIAVVVVLIIIIVLRNL